MKLLLVLASVLAVGLSEKLLGGKKDEDISNPDKFLNMVLETNIAKKLGVEDNDVAVVKVQSQVNTFLCIAFRMGWHKKIQTPDSGTFHKIHKGTVDLDMQIGFFLLPENINRATMTFGRKPLGRMYLSIKFLLFV